MRLMPVFLLALFAASPSLAASPALRALSGWLKGSWQVTDLGDKAVQTRCVSQPDAMLLANRPDASCQFSVIRDDASSGVVTYRCAEGRQGRTELRRDTAGLFNVDAQGIEGGRPFASRTEWRRVGAC